MNNGLRHISKPSIGSVLSGGVIDVKDSLMRPVMLPMLVVRYELRKGLTAAMGVGIGVGIFAGGGILLMLMLVQGLAEFMAVPLWAGYGIAGSALIVLGWVVLAAGRTKAENPQAASPGSVKGIKDRAQWLAKPTTSNKKLKKPVKISRLAVPR